MKLFLLLLITINFILVQSGFCKSYGQANNTVTPISLIHLYQNSPNAFIGISYAINFDLTLCQVTTPINLRISKEGLRIRIDEEILNKYFQNSEDYTFIKPLHLLLYDSNEIDNPWADSTLVYDEKSNNWLYAAQYVRIFDLKPFPFYINAGSLESGKAAMLNKLICEARPVAKTINILANQCDLFNQVNNEEKKYYTATPSDKENTVHIEWKILSLNLNLSVKTMSTTSKTILLPGCQGSCLGYCVAF